MSSLTIDEKLYLIQKMRNQSENISQNTYDRYSAYNPVYNYNMKNRNDISVYNGRYDTFDNAEEVRATTDGFRFLKYRIFLCLMAFTFFFTCYKMKLEIKGHEVTEVNVLLEENIFPEKLHNSLKTLSEQIVEQY